MFNGKNIFITGGTGSFGKKYTDILLSKYKPNKIIIFSRDELKQFEMKQQFNHTCMRYFIGDIRDKDRLSKAMQGVDYVIHAAALKHVPKIEYNPFEAIKTNVQGAQNLVEACLNKDVEFALAIGTDKAVSPFNTYGATKLLMERLFVSANYYKGEHKTKFACVRYGNVLGSRGSIIPKFIEQIISGNKITITDPNMTRFNITLDQALDLIFRVIKNAVGGDVHIPKLDAFKVGNMKDVLLDLKATLSAQNIQLPDNFFYNVQKYKEHLHKWNKIHNLTGAKDNETLYNFIYDAVFPVSFLPKVDSLMDIGTGAGFPGMILAFALRDTHVTLVEPLMKRSAFFTVYQSRLRTLKCYSSQKES